MKNTKNTKNSASSSANRLWIYGKHAVLAALENPKRHCYQLLLTRNTAQELEEQAHITDYKLKVKFLVTDTRFIESLLPSGAVHQGIALETAPLPEKDLEDHLADFAAKERSCIVLLDQVTDPHNIGAILRSATAFGADALIVTRHNSPQETGTLAKTACGGLEMLPMIKITNLVSAIATLKEAGYWCLGMDGEARDSLDKHTSFAKVVLILGAEGKGLRRLTREHCDVMVKLPTTGPIKSLNVSNAAAIALYALRVGEM